VSVCLSEGDKATSLQYCKVLNVQTESYKGESNENLKSAIKIRNTARLSVS